MNCAGKDEEATQGPECFLRLGAGSTDVHRHSLRAFCVLCATLRTKCFRELHFSDTGGSVCPASFPLLGPPLSVRP